MSDSRATELVRRVVANHASFKDSAKRLAALPPDPEAVDILLNAFNGGEAPPWLTALLLGQIGHASGYDVVRRILLTAPELLAESYAGVALARIGGPAVLDDLVNLMRNALKLKSREGAAYGLGHLGTPEAIHPVLLATRETLIRSSTGASILAKLPVRVDDAIGLLASPNARDPENATELIAWRVASSSHTGPFWSPTETLKLVSPLRRLLLRPHHRMALKKRRSCRPPLVGLRPPSDSGGIYQLNAIAGSAEWCLRERHCGPGTAGTITRRSQLRRRGIFLC
jgi:hypothetical protein